MLPLRSFLPAFCFFTLASQGLAQPTTVQGEPFGYVKVNIAPGSGGTPKITYFSIPLLDSISIGGKSQGTVTAVTSNTIADASAGWTPGGLSSPTNRFLIQMVSGDATGRMFLIATNSNSATNVRIDTTDTSTLAHGPISGLGIKAGDAYRIHPCDTLNSFFGSPPTGLLGGTSVSAADSILVNVNGTSTTYFYHTASNRWVSTLRGFPDATHTPLPPHRGYTFSRRGTAPLTLTAVGRVPTASNRVTPIRNSGSSIVSQYWPVATAISNLGFDKIPGWVKGTNVTTADRLTISTNSGAPAKTYYFHSLSNAWVENLRGNPVRGNVTVPVGSSISVTRIGTAGGSSMLRQAIPYNLQSN
jgi:hypothetical protein